MPLTDRKLVEYALNDAIRYQEQLAKSYPAGSPEREEARRMIARYMSLRKKRYGEIIDNAAE